MAEDELPTESERPPTVVDLGRRALIEARKAAYADVLRIWNDEIVPKLHEQGIGVRAHPRLSPHNGIGLSLSQRIAQQGAPAVLAVLRWYRDSEHERAVFLREKGMGLDTLVSSKNFDKYLAFSQLAPGEKPAERKPSAGASVVAKLLKRTKEAAK